MFLRYLITIFPTGHDAPASLDGESIKSVRYELPRSVVVLESPDGTPDEYLAIERPTPHCLVITEGYTIPNDSGRLPHSGAYNIIELDDEAGEARLHNDAFASLMCYYSHSGGVLRISNSLRLMRRGSGLPLNDLGVAEMFLFPGWTEGGRTILRDAWRADSGMEYRFRLFDAGPPAARRLSDLWTRTIDDPVNVVVDRVCALWQRATQTHFDPIDGPIGLMLSGGLDSRMVAGAAASRGKQLVALTHGDVHSDEMMIAGQVAAAAGGEWIACGMDASYPFERLDFERVSRTSETMYNIMWDANAPALAAEGARHFSTGAGLDRLLGGVRDSDKRTRLMRNFRNAVIGPWKEYPASAEERQHIAESFAHRAEKRIKNYVPLLAEPFRTIMHEQVPAIGRNVLEWMNHTADSVPISAGQLEERFRMEYVQNHHNRQQERQLYPYGRVVLPSCDYDLASYLSNLPAAVKYDHALYYRVFRRLYPKLAEIPVPNLGRGINRPQWLIELGRAWDIKRQQRLTAWVNFSEYMKLGDNLDKYERLFLNQEHFFDTKAISEFFADVRAGRTSLYDGNETAAFLSLAYLLDERRLAN